MKKHFFNLTAIALTGLVLFAASQVSAWNAPSKANPATQTFGNIPAEIINTGCVFGSGECNNKQGKFGAFITESFLKAGNLLPWSTAGSVVAENLVYANRSDALFYKVFAPGTTGQLTFGINRGLTSLSPTVPVVGAFNDGKNKIKMLADGGFCNTQTSINTDTPAIQFWSTSANSNANILARGIQLSGGNPQPGMILISTDAQGNAVWATPVLNADGTITFNHAASPVVAGQASCD